MAVLTGLGPGLLAGVLGLLAAQGAPSAPPRPTEYEVKAAFLYNFGKFVRWTAEPRPGAPFVVAVLGDDPFGPVLDRTLAGKVLLNRTVEVRRLRSLDSRADVRILFVGSSERERLREVLDSIAGTDVLTVGEMERFVERGGMIGFQVTAETVRFDINLGQVDRAGLKMSSQLLRIARQVLPRPEGR